MHSTASLPDVIEVAIIEDRPEVREGLALLINSTEGYRCTQRFGSMEQALGEIGRHPPHVALIDIGLPGMSGIEGVRILKQRYPKILLLILTVYKDDDRIFEAMCAGACGYLLKKTPPARLLESVKEVMSGGAPMSPEVARRVVELFRRFHPPADADYRLSPQELHLLKLLGEGHHYKTAAAEMGLSIHTVGFHMRHIYEKLQVHSKSEAVAKALRDGLIR
ncbi:MAG: response regulator transcription factor [Acidobacteria bacterium]|nr:response regulator transcription factor [Acidobacteriota bacterium]